MKQVIGHIDMDAFFAAVEELCHPSWRGRPLVVCGNPRGRGVVSTASYAARDFGIRSGMPVAEARRRCPGGLFVPVDGHKYTAASSAVFGIVFRMCPQTEVLSIDEAVLDLGCEDRPLSRLAAIQKQIYRETGLSSSAGMGENRLLAKLASEHKKPGGLFFLRRRSFLHLYREYPVNTLPGIGQSIARQLQGMGVRTVGDLRSLDRQLLRFRFGVAGDKLYDLARGISGGQVLRPEESEPEKSCGHEYTLPEDTTDPALLVSILRSLADRVGLRLRERGREAWTLTLRLRFADFHTITRSGRQARALYWPEELFEAARLLWEEAWTGRALRLVGLSASGLQNRESEQLELFRNNSRDRALGQCMDELAGRFGKGMLIRASSLPQPGEQEHRNI